MYPRLIVDLKKLESNLDAVAKITKEQGGCSLMIVTKGLCADKEMCKMVAKHPAVDFMADSRVANIKSYAYEARTNEAMTVLLRIPMHLCSLVYYLGFIKHKNCKISQIQLLKYKQVQRGLTPVAPVYVFCYEFLTAEISISGSVGTVNTLSPL